LTTLAVATADDANKLVFGDTAVTGSDVLVMYTYAGDADLSGFINGDDYTFIDAGFAGNLTGYVNGDFDYSGKIDADDYFLIDVNYTRQGAPFSAAAPLSGATAVPEPAAGLTSLGLACTLVMKPRRRASTRRMARHSGISE
jgi:hypothetical protein